MDHVIGIDLGTTNCCVAIVENDRPRVLQDEKGYTIQPSYVSVHGGGKYTVGHAAKAQAISKPGQTLYGIKRIIGRRFDSPEVEEMRRRVTFEIVQGSKLEAEVRVNGQTFSASDMSGILLGNMREIASRALGVDVRKAVVTVPAYFNHSQRKATIRAGDTAGLEIVRLLNEPTAAALAYGFRKQIDDKILVFDLGGGTFDVSILEVGGDVYEVLATNGDSFLGGDDFDRAIVEHLVDVFRQSESADVRADKVAMQRLKDAAESAKCELSFTESVTVRLPNLAGRSSLQVDLTRAKLEQLVAPLMKRCMDMVLKTLKEAKLEPNQIDDVLLVGGQPRMPAIQRQITDLFKKAPCRGVHPDEAIAVGAAIQAASLGESSSLLLLDVTPFSLGIDAAGDVFSTIVEKNATVPVSGRRTFTTVRDGQSQVRIVVRQGESRKASENGILGEFVLEGIRTAPRMEPKIDVTFRIDSNGILHVVAKDQDTGEHQSISIHDYPDLARTGGGREAQAGGDDKAQAPSADAKAKAKGGGLLSRLAAGLKRGKAKDGPAPVVAPTFDDGPEAASAGATPEPPRPESAPPPPVTAGRVERVTAEEIPSQRATPVTTVQAEELEEVSQLDDLDDDGAARKPEGLFHVRPPTPSVGEAPADPFAAEALDDALGDAWSDVDVEDLDDERPFAPPVADADRPVGEGIDLAALEQALSDLDFDLPAEAAEIDLDALGKAIQQPAEAASTGGVPQDLDKALADLMNEAGGLFGSEPDGDPFAIASLGDADPFAIAPLDVAASAKAPRAPEPHAIRERAVDDERPATASRPAPETTPDAFAVRSAEAGDDDPFAIADLLDEMGGAERPLTRGDADPFAIRDLDDLGTTPSEDDLFAIQDLDAAAGDDDLFAIQDLDAAAGDDDPFAIQDLEVVADLEKGEDPFAIKPLADDEAEEDVFALVSRMEAELEALSLEPPRPAPPIAPAPPPASRPAPRAPAADPFGLANKDADLAFALVEDDDEADDADDAPRGATLRAVREPGGDEVTGSFDLEALDFGGPAVSRDGATRTRRESPPPVIEEPSDTGRGEVSDPTSIAFGIIGRDEGVITFEDDEKSGEFDFDTLFSADEGAKEPADPFGLTSMDALEVDEAQEPELDLYGLVSADDDGPAPRDELADLFGLADAEDADLYGLVSVEDEADPFGIVEGGQDPVGLAEKVNGGVKKPRT